MTFHRYYPGKAVFYGPGIVSMINEEAIDVEFRRVEDDSLPHLRDNNRVPPTEPSDLHEQAVQDEIHVPETKPTAP